MVLVNTLLQWLGEEYRARCGTTMDGFDFSGFRLDLAFTCDLDTHDRPQLIPRRRFMF